MAGADAGGGGLGPVADDRPGRLRGAIGRLSHHFPLRQGCPSRPDATHWARTGAHWCLFGQPAPRPARTTESLRRSSCLRDPYGGAGGRAASSQLDPPRPAARSCYRCHRSPASPSHPDSSLQKWFCAMTDHPLFSLVKRISALLPLGRHSSARMRRQAGRIVPRPRMVSHREKPYPPRREPGSTRDRAAQEEQQRPVEQHDEDAPRGDGPSPAGTPFELTDNETSSATNQNDDAPRPRRNAIRPRRRRLRLQRVPKGSARAMPVPGGPVLR